MSGRRLETRRQAVPTELLAPYRMLALRVITLAVRDLVTYGPSASERSSALAFLSGSRMLNHWCRLADIDPAVICEQVSSLVNGKRVRDAVRRH